MTDAVTYEYVQMLCVSLSGQSDESYWPGFQDVKVRAGLRSSICMLREQKAR